MRIFSWHNKLLSFGGKQILISHVLPSIPIYLLVVMSPPKKVIESIQQFFSKFLWSNAGGIKGKHWVAWKDLCYPRS